MHKIVTGLERMAAKTHGKMMDIFKKYDSDGSGQIDQFEARGAVHAWRVHMHGMCMAPCMRMAYVHGVCILPRPNAHGTMIMACGQFSAALAELGLEVPPEEGEKVFALYDADASGTLGFKELEKLIKGGRKALVDNPLLKEGALGTCPEYTHAALLPLVPPCTRCAAHASGRGPRPRPGALLAR